MQASNSKGAWGRERRERELEANWRALVEDKNLAISTGEKIGQVGRAAGKEVGETRDR
jgi:hypothetical protein